MAKQLMFDDEARKKIRIGLGKLAAAVKVTMGPAGRNVILQKSWGSPSITKDGVSVSKEVELEDPFENMGAKLVNEVAKKTADECGDGTTTATVLAEAIYTEGLKAVTGGVNPMSLKRGIDKSVEAVVKHIGELSKPVKTREQVAQVGAISANNDRVIGDLLANAFDKVGSDGVITIEEGQSIDTTLDFVEGMQFDKGYISPYFVTDPKTMEVYLEDPYILLHEKKLSSMRELIPLLEKIAGAGAPLLIISEDVDGEALAALVVNKLRGVLNVAAVKAPGFGDRRKALLEDIAIMTKGRLITEDLGINLESLTINDLGRAKSVRVDKENTIIVQGAGSKSDLNGRIAQIKAQIESSSSDYDREKLQERLAKLSGGVAVINVGAATETEMKEKKARVDDALHATRAASEEGIVTGGGTAFIRSLGAIEGVRSKLRGDEKYGAEIVLKALEAPLRQIADNAGADGAVIVQMAKEKTNSQGYDAAAGEWVDMYKAGIIDPAKVVRTALQNAASIAGLLITTDTLVTDYKEEGEEEDQKVIEGAVV